MKKHDVIALNHYRPRLVRLFNKLGPKVNLDVERLLLQAEKKAGLDLKDEDLDKEAISRLFEAVEKEGNLHRVGRFLFKERILGMLVNRLRAKHYFKQYPEIRQEKIERPIIITGLQRTGTTLLHRLLSQDNDNRTMLSWEGLNPAPNPRKKKDDRIAQAKIAERAVRYLSPHFFAIHPVEHHAPEEDILLNDMTFLSTVPEATLHVPSYAAWAEQQDHTPAYAYMKSMLQLLQWQKSGKRWILKTPQHLEFLPVLKKIFPKALFVFTHRDPLQVMPSFSSMVYHGRRIFSDEVDAKEVAQHWLRKNGYAMNRALKFRKNFPDINAVDIYYKNLITNPLECIKCIYDAYDISLKNSTTSAMKTFLTANKQHKYGRHRYHIKDFSLTKEQIRLVFKDYLETFGHHL